MVCSPSFLIPCPLSFLLAVWQVSCQVSDHVNATAYAHTGLNVRRRLPRVGFRRLATWTWPNHVEARLVFGRQRDRERSHATCELIQGLRPADQRRGRWIVQQPGQGQVRRRLAELPAELFVRFQLGTVALDLPLPDRVSGSPGR